MGLTRAKILRGPAKMTDGTLWYWTADDISLMVDDGVEERRSSMYGPVDRMVMNPKVQATFAVQGVTAGTSLATLLTALIPPIFTNGYYGASYIGAGAEKTWTIWGTGGDQVVIHSSIITKPPQVAFGANKPLLGSMTVTGICKTTGGDIVLGANNSLYTASEGVADPGGVFAGLPSFLQQRYKGVWGTQTGFTEIWAEDGWLVDFNPGWNERKIQGLTIDYEMTAMEIISKCAPAGPTMKQVLDVLGVGGTSGASWGQGSLMSAQQTANDLTIVDPAAATVFTQKKPVIRQPGFKFGYVSLRTNELAWHSQVRFAAGVPGVLAAF